MEISVRYILSKQNIVDSLLSYQDQIIPTKWFLLFRVFHKICQICRRSVVDLFTTERNIKLPVYVSLVTDSTTWKKDAFQHPWDHNVHSV